jgi:hypothetical protein
MSLINIMLNVFIFLLYFFVIIPVGLIFRIFNIFKKRNQSTFYTTEKHRNSQSIKDQY